MDRRRAIVFYLAALAASLLPALLSAVLVWQVRTTDYATGATTALNIAKLIANNFENSFDRLDALLTSTGRQYVEGVEGGNAGQLRLVKQMQADLGDFPFVARIFATDATGKITLGAGDFMGGTDGKTVADRPYFSRAAAGDRSLIFEGPFKAEFADGWVVALSKRLENAKGEFLGAIVANIPVESFEKRLAAVELFPHGVIVLRSATGLQIARYSLDSRERGSRERGLPGDQVISPSLQALLHDRSAVDHAFYETIAPQDRVERLYAFQRLSQAPFFLLIGQPKAVLDRNWRLLAVELGLFSLAGIVVSLWIARRMHASAVSLNEEKRLLEQRVADRTQELASKNRDLVASEARAEAASKAKSVFLATMSHEIRTPLNAIMGTTQLLARSALDTEQQSFVRTLDSASQNMLVLLSEVLDLSKIEAGQLELDKAPFSLTEIVACVADTFAVSAESKGLTLRIEPMPDDLPAVVGDVVRLGQVLNNLVGNAVKFTSEGEVAISVEALDRSAESLRVRFSVRDTGIGIAEEKFGKLFDPFVQAEKTTHREFGGTGLGLAIGKRLIQLMDGVIGVESDLGRGSEFWFIVTFDIAPPKETQSARPVVRRAGKQLSGARILIVDDIATNRDLVSKLLTLEGAHCETAENGREAVEKLRANPNCFDLVLMDVQMPEMDGLEATRAIRQDLRLADLPVIALTAGAMVSQRELALAAGMNSFIVKPFRLNEMVATLSPWLRQAQS